MARNPFSNKGFTLIEVMVAISIFAVVAAGVYRVLSAMVDTQSRVVSHSESLRDLQRSLWLMSNDMNQLVMRDARKPGSGRSPAFIADDGDYLLLFTRQGGRNPLLQARSDLDRVAYSIGPLPENVIYQGNDKAEKKRSKKSKNLLRHTWPAVDRKENAEDNVQVLFRDVDEVRMEFLDEKGDWKSDWPEKKLDDKAHIRILPEAVKIQIKSERYGDLERVFQVGNVVQKQKVPKVGPKPNGVGPGEDFGENSGERPGESPGEKE